MGFFSSSLVFRSCYDVSGHDFSKIYYVWFAENTEEKKCNG